MTDNLIRRLRDRNARRAANGWWHDNLAAEAADTLEALEAKAANAKRAIWFAAIGIMVGGGVQLAVWLQ